MISKKWILDRLDEPSTWRGAIMIVTAAGVPVNPVYAEYIIAIGMAVSGLIGVLTTDKKATSSHAD